MPSAKILESKKAQVKALNEEIVASLAGVVVARSEEHTSELQSR